MGYSVEPRDRVLLPRTVDVEAGQFRRQFKHPALAPGNCTPNINHT